MSSSVMIVTGQTVPKVCLLYEATKTKNNKVTSVFLTNLFSFTDCIYFGITISVSSFHSTKKRKKDAGLNLQQSVVVCLLRQYLPHFVFIVPIPNLSRPGNNRHRCVKQMHCFCHCLTNYKTDMFQKVPDGQCLMLASLQVTVSIFFVSYTLCPRLSDV